MRFLTPVVWPLAQWARRDSNPRRRMPADLQSAGIEQKPPRKPGERKERATAGATLSGLAGLDDPDLSTVVDNWPALPEAVKIGILAMVRAASAR